MQRISDWLRDHPEGREQLAEIERSLKPLEDSFEAVEAPSDDLLARTLAAIPDGIPPIEDTPVEDTPADPPVTLTDVDLSGEAGAGGNRWNIMDSIGGLLSVATLLALLLPTIAAGRFEARKVACEDRLRRNWTALMQYVYRSEHGRLPEVAESGREAFAGMFAIRLADAGLLDDADQRWCPSADLPMLNDPVGSEPSETSPLVSLSTLPSVESLHKIPYNDLKQVQQHAGGHYAYTLGVIGDQGFSSPRFEARASFAVMADAPLEHAMTADQPAKMRFSHSGQGINVLYEDGSIRFIPADSLDSMPDHPFFNHRGTSEAGVNIDDASLSPSWRAPFSISLQR
ncbi:hypothetical protein Enr13x_63550 [Stieleria neptunia]|uniref:DUF1559 domain-containing protein n=1 Tax=Stieleria neptunia TaxID=2527979 RepID=A0A518I004_9BACT|nr:hypothetical protein [Stieleria neptunia]QDV46446.1 hypothetical protein Enr13x_63550 [Stieleria neptunia]